MRRAFIALALAVFAGCGGGSAEAGVGQMMFAGNTPPSATGSATVTWAAPVLDVAAIGGQGGSAISDIAGYKVWKRQDDCTGDFTLVTTIVGTGTLTYTVTGLTPATWCIAVSTYDNAGNVGPRSFGGTKVIP